MLPEDRDRASLADMLSALEKISERLAGKSLEDLRADEVLFDSVVRQFTILGEAARRVTPGTAAKEPGIPWRDIIGLRNVVVHQYDDVNATELWRAFLSDIPAVIPRLRGLLATVATDRAPERL